MIVGSALLAIVIIIGIFLRQRNEKLRDEINKQDRERELKFFNDQFFDNY